MSTQDWRLPNVEIWLSKTFSWASWPTTEKEKQ